MDSSQFSDVRFPLFGDFILNRRLCKVYSENTIANHRSVNFVSSIMHVMVFLTFDVMYL